MIRTIRNTSCLWTCVLPGLLCTLLAGAAPAEPAAPLDIAGEAIAPGSVRRVKLRYGDSFDGNALTTPVLIAHGAHKGPVLCVTAAIHGDELNGIEVVRRIVHARDPARLSGTVIGVPVVNLLGFARGSRETPDRRDLNRYFPGRPDGDFASRIAYRLFSGVIEPHCHFLVDLHTGSFNRANLPQLRADLSNPAVRRLAASFGTTPVMRKRGSSRMLRRVASERGIPAVSLEFGESTTLQAAHVEYAVSALETALASLGLVAGRTVEGAVQPIYEKPFWIRTERGGIFLSRKQLGDMVNAGEVVGLIANPLTDEQWEIVAPKAGRILGLASDQFVLPGYGVFHVGQAVMPGK
ncbi:MAG: succinylglutamate desuccinylase/aspartoacylase family protein [Gammaproteobacteria bacterium]